MSGATTQSTATGASVVIVDDHGLLAQSLSFSLRADGLEVTRCGDLTREAIQDTVEREDPQVVLLDLDVGGELGTTLSLIPDLAVRRSVVMLTGVGDPVRIAECIEAGAVGVISKSVPYDELVEAVRRVVAEGALVSTAEREDHLALLRRHRNDDRQRLRDFEQLTPREQQVLAALMDGRSADQIAADWVVSITTVRSQIRSLLLKLDVNSQLAAVAYARRSGWEPGDG